VGMAAALVDDTIICRCEGVTAGDIRQGQSLGPDEINRAKAYTRLGMGRCQGRMCGIAAAEILAHQKGVSLAEVGRLRGQAPIKPLQIGIAGAAAEDDPERAASI
ncbi:MAG TPA: FAD/NAD(P)-binding oxidoreductase, partial [Alphaproteobacteria bacterium]|nr:FAD/NAD(P)-binding oxidoreductase [Alphaproteobacteria bacterium]